MKHVHVLKLAMTESESDVHSTNGAGLDFRLVDVAGYT